MLKLIHWLRLFKFILSRRLNFSELYTGFISYFVNKVPISIRVKRNADSFCTCTGCASRPVYICLSVFWWFNLNDYVDSWYVKTPSRHISSNKASRFTFFDPLHRYFTLSLSNIAVHHFDILLELISLCKWICVILCLRKYNWFAAWPCVLGQHISQHLDSLIETAGKDQVLDVLVRFIR
jgi:hypothetical protein